MTPLAPANTFAAASSSASCTFTTTDQDSGSGSTNATATTTGSPTNHVRRRSTSIRLLQGLADMKFSLQQVSSTAVTNFAAASTSNSSSASSSILQTSATEIPVEEFENFCTLTLSQYWKDEEKAEQLVELVRELAEHYRASGNRLCGYQAQFECPHCCKAKTEALVLALHSAIEAIPELPADKTAEVHSYVGLFSYKHGDFAHAIPAFLKALWIHSSLVGDKNIHNHSSNKNSNNNNAQSLFFKIALTEHRLGLSYGKSAKFEHACRLLEKALEEYQKHAHVSLHSELFTSAQQALQDFRQAHQIATILAEQKERLNQQIVQSSNKTPVQNSIEDTHSNSNGSNGSSNSNSKQHRNRATSLMVATSSNSKPLLSKQDKESSKRRLTFQGVINLYK